MTASRIPKAPEGAGPAGKRLWRQTMTRFELEEHETVLLTAMVRQTDRLTELEALIAAEGLTVEGHGTTKMHPAVIEARNTAIAVARIAAALRLPAGEEQDDDLSQPQRRSGVRGVYGLRALP